LTSLLLEKDAWKEEVLISLDDESQIVFDAEQDDSKNYVDI
jgi:type III restriction enzyme